MTIRDLVVHLDRSDACTVRLGLAVQLARRFDAKLTGIYACASVKAPSALSAKLANETDQTSSDLGRNRFLQATTGLSDANWIELPTTDELSFVEMFNSYARCADLTIVGHDRPGVVSSLPEHFIEDVVVCSGATVLIVPYAGDQSAWFNTALVAWNNSREATHAIRGALPLLQSCESVNLIALDYEGENHDPSRMADHLWKHGVNVRFEELPVRDIGVMDMLLNRVSDLGSGLLVVGAHEYVSVPFFSTGRGTRYLIESMTVPVLMSR